MKNILTIKIILVTILVSCKENNKQTEKEPKNTISQKAKETKKEKVKKNTFIVTAENGINIRETPNLKSKRIGFIPFGSKIDVLEITNEELKNKDNVEEIKGKWVKIKTYNDPYYYSEGIDIGYVFNGFIKKEELKNNSQFKKIKDHFFINESKGDSYKLPIEIKNKFGDSIILLSEKSLGEWKISSNLDTIKNPTRIIYDFDKNKKLDFIGIIKNINQDFPVMIFIKDFNNTKSQIDEIGYVKDYGEKIGSIIYLNEDKNGFYQNNLESSLIEYEWDGNKFKNKYLAD